MASASAVAVAAWVMATQAGGVVHGHPTYGIMLTITLLGGAWGSALTWLPHHGTSAQRWLSVTGLILAFAWIALMAWLRPMTAQEVALEAMKSDSDVTVQETVARIELAPTQHQASTMVFFQPGARVDARAYVPTLRPLAEAGYRVVIVKQPLGIAFTSMGALNDVRADHPDAADWVIGGHSLGGTVAAMAAVETTTAAPVIGLFFWASYPADSIRETFTGEVASISGTRDGLATPDKIDPSRADLPADTVYTVIDGACHAQFGDYGAQPGDNTPTISNEEARAAISDATLAWVDAVTS